MALGAERVLYVDQDPERRAIAEGYGAETLDDFPEQLEGRYPITVDASASRAGLALALGSLDRDGVCTSTGIYFDPETVPPFPLLGLYVLGGTFQTGRVHARHDAPAVLDLLAAGTWTSSRCLTQEWPSTTPPMPCSSPSPSWCSSRA